MTSNRTVNRAAVVAPTNAGRPPAPATNSIDGFHAFARAVEARFRAMSEDELFIADVADLFDTYLDAFPEGTNPLVRVRTQHDCSCCRNFVRNLGHVVSVKGGAISTVWDLEGLPHPYSEVASRMAEHVRSNRILSVFRTTEGGFGAEQTLELREDLTTHRWNHFFGRVSGRHLSNAPAATRGEYDGIAQVLRRGLEELTPDAIETVLDLVRENALYRGAEFERVVMAFRDLHARYPRDGSSSARDAFVWANIGNPAAGLKNTAIGTLVEDLSSGIDVARAVRSFETKVAPQNYKRPSSLITKRMIEDAVAKLRDLGLESAIERRFARLSDVSVNNVLFVDNSVRGGMRDGLVGLLMGEVRPAKVDVKGAEAISMDDFLSRIVPQASSIELLLENGHLRNFMSLTAPVHPDAGKLFKWGNGFAWSYDGDAADSIKQRVKRAGGNIEADLRVSLAWFNTDDLDLHAHEPSGRHIGYMNKCGILDVDMNVSNLVRDPVENMAWKGSLRDGRYRIEVNQFTRRETTDVGFVLEVEHGGTIQTFAYDRAVSGTVPALVLIVRKGALAGIEVGPGLHGGSVPQDMWGVRTEALVPVDTLMASPNHWDGQAVGNKHWFFLLKGCRNPNPARGVYNEFLSGALEPHRKVFEVLGAKAKCPVVDDQLSGVGFSSTRHDRATVVVKGRRINKAFNISF